MARPRREGLDYFPMDTDFFESDGALLAAGEDPLALGVYLRLLCRIYRGETGYACAWGEREAALLAARMPEQPGAQRVEQAAAACARAGLFDEELLRRGLLTSRDIQRRYFSAVGKRLLKRLSRDGEIRLNGDGLLLDGAEIAELICGESRRPAGMALRRADGGICLRLIPQRRENQSHRKTETKQEINPKAETEEEQDSPPPAGEAAAPFAPAAFAPAGSAPAGFAPAASVPEESSFPEGNGTGTAGEEAAETGEAGALRAGGTGAPASGGSPAAGRNLWRERGEQLRPPHGRVAAAQRAALPRPTLDAGKVAAKRCGGTRAGGKGARPRRARVPGQAHRRAQLFPAGVHRRGAGGAAVYRFGRAGEGVSPQMGSGRRRLVRSQPQKPNGTPARRKAR